MKATCVRRLWFCCGHRIVGHENKCANVHGHNYTLFVHAQAEKLDQIGRVVDFSVLKEKLGSWIDENWDHTFLIYEDDPILMPLVDTLSVKKKAFVCSFNPTAENMAGYLLNTICPKIFENDEVRVTSIELLESDNNKVMVTLV